MTEAKYAVGIDLGTTNCVMAAIHLEEKGRFPPILTVPLLQRLGEEAVGTSLRLPSFLYWPTQAQQDALPEFSQSYDGWVVGEGAAVLGRRVTGRLVTSAKSWLCHGRVDRTENILPWGGEEGIPKLSPLKATEMLLRHLAQSWEASDIGQGTLLKDQQLTITLPASFDQVARELTVEACRQAGLDNARLLEEPQAAFYNWITLMQGRWDQVLGGAERVLICDVGGGTSDFSLIHCHKEGESMSFEREAVGQHLLLGGDNMDLALAHLAETRLSGSKKKLNQSQWQLLAQLTRSAKETLLSGKDDLVPIRLPGAGRKVIGGMRQTELSKEEVQNLILEGFFPMLDDDFVPRKNSGVQELGLPYEAEPSVTYHILNFIEKNVSFGYPEAILFNGGALEPEEIRTRIKGVLERKAPESIGEMKVLESDSLADAVARGAAYYSFITLRGGLKIGGGSSRGYYLGLQTQEGLKQACVIPKGTEPHEPSSIELAGLEVMTNQPVSFELYQSDQHPSDEAGVLRFLGDGGYHSGRLNTLVRFGKRSETSIPVRIEGELTELDTLKFTLVSKNTPHRWDLEFDLRGQSEDLEEEAVDEAPPSLSEEEAGLDLDEALLLKTIEEAFAPQQPKSPLKMVESIVEHRKSEWPLPFLRKVADSLLLVEEQRKRSAAHERVWLSSYSFVGRPGFGDPSDEIRRQKLWSLYREEPISRRDSQCLREWAILWRRMAPGLESGRQSDLFQRNKRSLLDKKGRAVLKGHGPELWRMMSSMESMPAKDKKRLGDALFNELLGDAQQLETLLWCIGRLGTRMPLKAQAESLLTSSDVKPWIEQLLLHPEWQSSGGTQALVECSRKCGDRLLDIDDGLREKVLSFLEDSGSGDPVTWTVPLNQAVHRELAEQSQLIGDGLPLGLTLTI